MLLPYVAVDLGRLLTLQFAVRTLESRFVSAFVLVMSITVTFQREAVQTLGTVKERALASHGVPWRYHAHQRIQYVQIWKRKNKVRWTSVQNVWHATNRTCAPTPVRLHPRDLSVKEIDQPNKETGSIISFQNTKSKKTEITQEESKICTDRNNGFSRSGNATWNRDRREKQRSKNACKKREEKKKRTNKYEWYVYDKRDVTDCSVSFIIMERR